MKRFLLLLPLVAGGARLAAQDADHGPSMAAWRDSLAAWPDASLRLSLARVGRPGDPSQRLRSAWLLAAAGQRFDSAGILSRAADQFYEVTVRRAGWVEAWYGLGQCKEALADLGAREVRSAHQTAGTGWVWGSASAYISALHADPHFGPAAIALAKLGPRLDSPDRARAAWQVTTQALLADSTDPKLWLVAGLEASETGDDSTALRDLDRGLALSTAPHGRFQLERARTLFTLLRPEAAESAYYGGATEPDSEGMKAYRSDLAYVADSAELKAWDSLPVSGRESWLREFWGGRDRDNGKPSGARLAEHIRRRRYALIHYRSIPTWAQQYDFEMIYHDAPTDVDDRGAVYIRHGKPDATAFAIGGQTPPLAPNESWLYYRPEGNLLFHFTAVGIRSGWHLVTSLTDIGGNSPYGPSAFLYESRMGLDPRFGILALRFEQDSLMQASNEKLGRNTTALGWLGDRTGATAQAIESERKARRADIQRGLTTDSDPLRFDHELQPIIQVFGAGGTGPRRGALIVAVSLPLDPKLPTIPLPDGTIGYTLRLRVTSGDDSGRTTLDADSVVRLRTAHPLGPGQHLSFVRAFPLPATGDQRVRLIVSDSARAVGAIRVVNGVPVPDLSTPSLTLSDLLVGRAGSGIDWQLPNGETIELDPLNAWSRVDRMPFSFEVGGASAGIPLHVQVAIGDISADTTRPPKSSVTFDQVASGQRTLINQIVALDALQPGRYLLTVTVTAGDQRVRRDRRITIVRQ